MSDAHPLHVSICHWAIVTSFDRCLFVDAECRAVGGLPPQEDGVHVGQPEGHVYVGSINDALMLATMALVVGFGSSSRLPAAYGIAVTLDMTITTILAENSRYERRFATRAPRLPAPPSDDAVCPGSRQPA